MLLDATTRKIQLVLTAAMTTANMPVCVYYVDSSASALPAPGMTLTNSNGITAVDILAAPAASTKRKLNALTVNNADTVAKTVQIYLDDNGADYLLCAATLQVGDVLGYTDTRGWYVNDSAGNLKVTPTNAISALLVTNTPAGNVAATNVQTAINELDTEKMALATYDPDGNGVVENAETTVLLCRNVTGVTIPKMSVVYISGASGQNPTIALAKADAEATSSKTIGVVTADIANNATGYIALSSEIHDYDTSAFADGTTLWLSAATAGAMTTTRPTAPNHAVLIGFTAYSHANNGKIALNITNGQELDELHDVLITTIANNELLQYDSATATWKNRSTLAGLTFVAPALGTPGSGDLRNCSLAVAPAIGGTTPAAGAFTTLNATSDVTNSQAGSDTVGSGASFIFSSGPARFQLNATGGIDAWVYSAGWYKPLSISASNVAVTGAISATTTLKSGGYIVATLPAGATGERAYVTDATAPTYLGALTGGGAVVCPVFKNASAWVSA